MRTRTTACTVLLALAAFTTGCGSSESTSKPNKPSSTSTPAAATQAAADADDLKACTKALEVALDADSEDMMPAECDSLSESDYQKAATAVLAGVEG
ncbi:hypothetical protein [Streptomyces griseiscabiei]|uniref:Secreted protein n=1 Tax=Streptomyces griseiscabiei TaxID=2993540 RepID=A0ABU4L4C9_9ACTN|nr:hypothetical protein [Streptomyces griseiscabiei]MBZ3905481.1 hypothetical protein [Streptomyces griseiscabiei]MDX2910572.1 hypothetical protein [Streptomyces griseiscabiei]